MLDGHHLYPEYLDLRADSLRYMPPHHHHHHHPHHLPPPPHHRPHHPVPPPPPPPPADTPEHPVNLYGMTMVERYLYSLPEYRTEMQRSNYIEIYSYNGLLATRKVIEFDGDTVLCRVCGDKASGFHYGVHACEGCKGFFRRSIQQKIQYRPCLKNQQCNIMRVNRNRCQYCRLKKCIAVGMSRDAVRFGRVPKKEKAKIMEQMHKVNSQSQVTLLNTILENGADITSKVVEAHLRTCEFTNSKLRAFLDKAWQTPQFVTCPAHMACPLNPSPETSDGTKKWDEFSECFTPAIRNVVNFAKCIPGFQLLSQEDQVTLLKAGTFEVLLVHLACLFDAQTNTMCFANGKLYKRVSLTITNSAGFLLDSMFDFAERLNTMQLSDEEVALFSAIVIIAADRPGLRNVEQVERVQNRITQALQTLMSSKHPDDPALFAKLLMKIPDLRTLNTLHSEKLLGLTVPAGSGKNGASGDKTRANLDSQPPYFPGSMMPGGFPMFGGPMMPGHMRDVNMPYSGHPPDVGSMLPHQAGVESSHQNHNVVLQTPLGTFHRYNSALQQHMSMRGQMDYPPPPTPHQPPHPNPRHGECPRRDKDSSVDIKPRDFHNNKFKMEDGVGNHVGGGGDPHHERSVREDGREGSRAGSPLTRDSVSVATSDSGSPKSDAFSPNPSTQGPSWASRQRQASERLPPEHHSSSGSSEHTQSKKHRLSEEDEMMISKMQKFWNEAGVGGCPVGGGAGYPGGLSGAMASQLPMSVLQNPSLMSAYRKEAMMQFHQQQQQQQQQYQQHHKQYPPNHQSLSSPPYHPDPPRPKVENHRQFPHHASTPRPLSTTSDTAHTVADQSRSPPASPSRDPSGEAQAAGNLPELKNALARPPLSSPSGWCGEARCDSVSNQHPEDSPRYNTEDNTRHADVSKRPASPSDPYFLNKKLKMKRRSSSDTVHSDNSLMEADGGRMSAPHPSPSYNHSEERHYDVESHSQGQAGDEPELQSAGHSEGVARSDHHSDSTFHDQRSSQADPPVLLRSPQFFGDSDSRECRNSPPMLVPETESMDHRNPSLSARASSPQRAVKPVHNDTDRHGLLPDKDSKIRHSNPAYENNNNNKYFQPDVSNSKRSESHLQDKPVNKAGVGHGMVNGVCGSGPYMGGGGGGVAPHPAYLPLPFPSVHPAIMYQYNQFAAAQMQAQLQQIQMAQAQMALHHQAAYSKAEGHYQGMNAPRGKDAMSHSAPSRGHIEGHREDGNKGPTSSEPLREGRPLNLSKPQDVISSNQPVFVKPEPL